MGVDVKRLLERSLRRSAIQPLCRRLASFRLAVLAYHGVDDPPRFEQQMDYVAATMTPVSMEDLERAFYGGRGLPRRAVLITFDDGERSVLEAAMPVMRARGLPGAVFVIAGLIGTSRPAWFVEAAELVRQGGRSSLIAPGTSPARAVEVLERLPDHRRRAAMEELRDTAVGSAPAVRQLTRAELRELEAARIRIGSHTVTHPCLDRCRDGDILRELLRADQIIDDITGRRSRAIAYPNGDWDHRVLRIAAMAGYRLGFAYDHRLARRSPSQPLLISRLRVESHISVDRLALTLSGLGPPLDRVWRGLTRGRRRPAQEPARV